MCIRDREYRSPGFVETCWRQESPIVVCGRIAGKVEICYLHEEPAKDEGPFLLEERSLIDAVAAAKTLKSRRADLLGQFYAEWRTRHLRPLVLVEYNRIPLIWPDGNVRITFDRHLTTGYYRQDIWDAGAGLQPVLEPHQVILEVKYDRFMPEFIQHMLDKSRLS